MDKKLERILQVAKSNGWSLKYRHVTQKNQYVLHFYARDFLDGFAYSVLVNDSDDENIFFDNVAKSIFDTWKKFGVEKETEKYLDRIACKSRFSEQANKIYMDVNHYIYNIYCMYFCLSK